jgi:uncharacterized protein YegP (UPF0339 family)
MSTTKPNQKAIARIEIHRSNTNSTRYVNGIAQSTPQYYLRLVSSNGNILMHSETYTGGRSGALRAAQSLVNALGIPSIKCVFPDLREHIFYQADIPLAHLYLTAGGNAKMKDVEYS